MCYLKGEGLSQSYEEAVKCFIAADDKNMLGECYLNGLGVERNGKPVNQLDLNGIFMNRFSTLYEAEEKTGINATSISKVINGHIKTAGGFLWEIDK